MCGILSCQILWRYVLGFLISHLARQLLQIQLDAREETLAKSQAARDALQQEVHLLHQQL